MGDTEKLEVEVTLTDKASPKAKQVGQDLSKGLGQLGGLAMGAVSVGAAAAGAALVGVGAGLKYSIDEALEAQAVQAQLANVLASTGGASGMTMESLNALAASMSQMTMYNEEEIGAAETMLLQFKEIGSEAFPQATTTALDLATRLGIDLPSAAKMLGKALETPGEGLLRLKTAGVAFTDEQTDMVKSMVESGNTADAQKYIMDALATSVGGAAEAAGSTLTGQWTIMKNMMDETAEDLGNAVLPALTEAFNSVRPAIMDLAKQFSDFVKSDEFKKFIADLCKWLRDELPVAISKAKDFWNTQLKPMLEKSQPLFDLLLPALGKLAEILGVILPPILTAFVKGWQLVFDGINFMLTPIKTLIDSWGFLSDKIKLVKDALTNLTLPDWLKPGSPTPLELGIRGINDALGGMSGAGLPGINASFNQLPATIGASGGGGSVIINFNAPVMGFSDEYALAQKLAPIIRAEINRR